MPFGTIKNFNEERGFGFVKPDDGGPDLFVHVTKCANQVAPEPGSRVSYDLAQGRDGRMAAVAAYDFTVKGGSIDHIAVITARMKGWKTRTFIEKECVHHREIAKAQGGVVKSKFKYGGKDYALGNHPCWELSRVAYQMTKKPYLAGGLALGAGYAWSALRRAERPVSEEFVAFHRAEQWQRLKRFFAGRKPAAAHQSNRNALPQPMEPR